MIGNDPLAPRANVSWSALTGRIPEPELMIDPDQVRAYAEADFGASNERFVELFGEIFPDFQTGKVLDLGCGTADIPRRFAQRFPQARLWALDGSETMLAEGRRRLAAAGVSSRVELVLGCLPLTKVEAQPFDVVLSNSLLHQLHEPAVFWQTLRVVSKAATKVFVIDLRRPATEVDVEQIVKRYAEKAPNILQNDFRASLRAAFRIEEVAMQLTAAELRHLHVKELDDRYLMVEGTLTK